MAPRLFAPFSSCEKRDIGNRQIRNKKTGFIFTKDRDLKFNLLPHTKPNSELDSASVSLSISFSRF